MMLLSSETHTWLFFISKTKERDLLGKSTLECTRTDIVTTKFALGELYGLPHIVGDLIILIAFLVFQLNLVVESGTHFFLYQNCNYQIKFVYLSLKVVYPLSFEHEVKKENIEHVRKAVNGFLWEKLFENMKINDMIYLFDKTIRNILYNFIPLETSICDNKNPPWVDTSLRKLTREAWKRFKSSNNNNQHFENLCAHQSLLVFFSIDIILIHQKRYWFHLLVLK